MWPKFRFTASWRRTPQASNMARSARSRFSFVRSPFADCHNLWDCSTVRQFSYPYADLLDALYSPDAGRQIRAKEPTIGSLVGQAAHGSHTQIDCSGARCRDSRWIRYRRTTVRLKESLGSEQYHSTNSSMACRYPRWASEEVRLFKTADFAWSKSGNRRTAFGLGCVRLRECLRGIVRGPP